MRCLLLFMLVLATLLPSLASGYDVLVLQSNRSPAYEEVLKGYRVAQPASQRTIVLADYANVDLGRILREDNPALILTVGDAAQNAVRTIRDTPVLTVMSLGINIPKAAYPNQTGISMLVQPERYMALFQGMKLRRVGVVHDTGKSGWYLSQARIAARKVGIELVVREVSSPRETIKQLQSMNGKVDALWMLPDTTAVTRETSEAFLRFGQNNAVPVIAFSASYLGLGAAAALEIDRVALGEQAAAMTNSILSGAKPNESSPVFPRRVTLKSNPAVLNTLKLPVPLSPEL